MGAYNKDETTAICRFPQFWDVKDKFIIPWYYDIFLDRIFLRSKIVKIIKMRIVSEIKNGQLFPLDMGGRGRKRFKEDGGRGGRSSILKLFS